MIGPETLGLHLMMHIYRLWELSTKTNSNISFFCALNLTYRLIYVDVEWSYGNVPL